MKRVLSVLIPFLFVCVQCLAVKITLFMDTDTFVKRAKDIVIAKCTSPPEIPARGLSPAHVEVLMVLKGDKKPGKLKIATIYPMVSGKTYMLTSLGGSAQGTDFLALPELSVVPIPSDFELGKLKGKSLKEQVQRVFSRRLYEVERALETLLREKALLDKGLRDREDELYTSSKPVMINRIHTTSAGDHLRKGIIFLDRKPWKMEWSLQSDRDKTGYFYFAEPGTNKFVWEFSPSEHSEIDELNGKILKARFYGKYSPGGKAAFGKKWGYNTVTVQVGQVILARHIDAPSMVYVIKLERQEKERFFIEYSVICD